MIGGLGITRGLGVIGGLGKIGAHTARALVSLGHAVDATTHRRTETPSFLAGRVTVEPLDVTDRDAFLTLADRHDSSAPGRSRQRG
jgi:nucleoside-diphosphate-sugar epimerase